PLFTLAQACAAAREAAASGGPLRDWVGLRVPEYSDLWRTWQIFDDRDVVRIPIDARAQRIAHSWLGDPSRAEQVATILAFFPSDENAKALDGLLDDHHTRVSGRPGKGVTWTYPVRERASRTLERWGRPPRRVPLSGPADFYRPLRAWHAGV